MADAMFTPAALAVALAVFLAVLLLLEGGYLLWRGRFGTEARRLEKQLEALAGGRVRAQKEVLRQRAAQPGLAQGLLMRSEASHRLQVLLLQADLSWRPTPVVLGSLGGGLLAFGVAQMALRQSLWVALLACLAAGATPWIYVLWRRAKRLQRLEHQLPEALDLMVRALRAGHAFSSALQMVAEEMHEPIASEFRMVHDEVNFGLNLSQALENLVERVPLTDLRYFVVAVMIQREAGGNLTELLGNLSRLIRSRLKLLSRVRVLSSEGRMSGWILVILPFALGAMFNYFNPEFMRPLWTDPLGITFLNWMLGLMLVGVVLMRKIVHIRV